MPKEFVAMAIVNMGNPSAHGPLDQHTCRAARTKINHAYPPLIVSVTHSPRKSPKLSMSIDTARGNVTEASLLLPVVNDAGIARLPSQAHERSDSVHHHLGELKENSTLYTQQYVVRSYDVGADKAMSITTIFSLLQDASLCHFNRLGITARDGFGATEGMYSLGLLWIVSKGQAQVLSFPRWRDVIEIDTWFTRPGKNFLTYEWFVRHSNTNEVLVKATSTWCMMNSKTRRLCKMPDVVREELDPFVVIDRYDLQERQIISTPIAKLDDHATQCTISSCRADLDGNKHVTNARYISWLLQSVPDEHMETHDLKSISIEYKRECGTNECLDSLTSAKRMVEASLPSSHSSEGDATNASEYELTHILRSRAAEAQHEVVRARTTWQSRPTMH